MRTLLKFLCIPLPWFLKRRALQAFFGYKIASSARIGISWFYPEQLEMAENAVVGHLNVAIYLREIRMGTSSSVARGNWITGYPKRNPTHFSHLSERSPDLILGNHAAITKYHHFDCTERISIGDFTTIAGYRSQFLSHSIDVVKNRQDAKPIEIGAYSFVGTNVVVLGGATLPDRSVLGAKSLLNKPFEKDCQLYAGVPARAIKALPENAAYFHREDGFVY